MSWPVPLGQEVRFSDRKGRPAFAIEQGNAVPAPYPDQVRHEVLHARRIAPSVRSVQPLGKEHLELGMPRKVQAGIDACGVEGALDLLPLLFGDDGQGALGFAADLAAEIAIYDAPDDADHQGQCQQGQCEAQPLGPLTH
jgi:hypothetical protein